MALIVITVHDGPQGAEVGVLGEPALDPNQPQAMLSPAQGVALLMLSALNSEPVKQDRGLIQLLS